VFVIVLRVVCNDFFLFRYFIDEVENWCKCFVLIVPIILLLVDYADANVISRAPHIGGIFINIRYKKLSNLLFLLEIKLQRKFIFSFFLLFDEICPTP
jgi:hypothetical protein